MIGLYIVKDIEEKVQVIQQRLNVASDRHKSYADLKRKDIEYEVGEKVSLKVSPWRKVLRFGKKGKLSLRFIGTYEVLERIEPVVYLLALPLELAKLHDVFHVSIRRDIDQMNGISCPCKRCKCIKIIPMMRSQKLYYLEK